jgi:hypothetical protein
MRGIKTKVTRFILPDNAEGDKALAAKIDEELQATTSSGSELVGGYTLLADYNVALKEGEPQIRYKLAITVDDSELSVGERGVPWPPPYPREPSD